MTEPQRTDHWAALASNIGAEPAPEEPQTPAASEAAASDAPMTAPPPPAIHTTPKPARPAEKRPARPPAWDELAGDLGIVVPPAPPPHRAAAPSSPRVGAPSETAPKHAAPIEAAPRPVEAAIRPDELAAEMEAELSAWNDMDPTATEPRSFEPQEALDIMDETADEFDDECFIESSDESAASCEQTGEGAAAESRERRPRRRRGRGRGRGRSREGERTTEARAADEHPDEFSHRSSDEDHAFARNLETEADGPAGEAAEGEADEGGRTEKRGRRRRRGRGRGRESTRGERTARAEKAVDETAHEFDIAEEDDDDVHAGFADEHEFEGDEDDEVGEEGESPRIGFRNIPTWQDAIGVMISKNMESRARNPGGSRGPGGGRGGRGGDRGRGRGRRPERR